MRILGTFAFGYFALMLVACLAIGSLSLFGLSVRSPDGLDLVILVLALFTGWIRIKIEPSGYVSLTPLVFFIGLLLGRPWSSLAGTLLSVLMNSRLLGHRSWVESVVDAGEESLAAGTLVLLFFPPGTRTSPLLAPGLAAFSLGVFFYLLLRILLAMARAFVFEGVSIRPFLLSAGKSISGHVLVLAGLSVGIFYLYSRAGYLVLALAVVALVEFYYPMKLISEQREVSFASLAMIAQAIDAKDPYTAKHSRNVAEIAVRIARVMSLAEEEVRKIRIGALLHDIGKIGVSGRIIRKPSELDPSEQATMRQHPVISANIMQPVELLADAAEIVRHHHEHYDGSGYPGGLKGESIPIGSRIILVADAFDAMTTDRPYRKGRSRIEALNVLRSHAGKQFDAKVVASLESIIHLT